MLRPRHLETQAHQFNICDLDNTYAERITSDRDRKPNKAEPVLQFGHVSELGRKSEARTQNCFCAFFADEESLSEDTPHFKTNQKKHGVRLSPLQTEFRNDCIACDDLCDLTHF